MRPQRPATIDPTPEADDPSRAGDLLAVFPTGLGWMALISSEGKLKRLTFGHASPGAAAAAFGARTAQTPPLNPWCRALVERLTAYARGARDDFRDVRIDLGSVSEFQRRVLLACRQIGYGRTLTYAQLAAAAGFPGAARAVGNCMARNRIPLVIPCHRVVGSNGSLGGYSAPGGLALKERLLALETREGGQSMPLIRRLRK